LRDLLGCLKFYLQRDSRLHIGVLYHVKGWYCMRGLRFARPPRNADFLCRIESGSLHRRKLMKFDQTRGGIPRWIYYT
jgi:hypothetical protein